MIFLILSIVFFIISVVTFLYAEEVKDEYDSLIESLNALNKQVDYLASSSASSKHKVLLLEKLISNKDVLKALSLKRNASLLSDLSSFMDENA